MKSKKADIALETIVKYVIIAIVAAVIIWFIYLFLVKGIGRDTIGPLMDKTTTDSNNAIQNTIS